MHRASCVQQPVACSTRLSLLSHFPVAQCTPEDAGERAQLEEATGRFRDCAHVVNETTRNHNNSIVLKCVLPPRLCHCTHKQRHILLQPPPAPTLHPPPAFRQISHANNRELQDKLVTASGAPLASDLHLYSQDYVLHGAIDWHRITR